MFQNTLLQNKLKHAMVLCSLDIWKTKADLPSNKLLGDYSSAAVSVYSYLWKHKHNHHFLRKRHFHYYFQVQSGCTPYILRKFGSQSIKMRWSIPVKILNSYFINMCCKIELLKSALFRMRTNALMLYTHTHTSDPCFPFILQIKHTFII